MNRLAMLALLAAAIAASSALAGSTSANAETDQPVEIPFALARGKIVLPVTVGRSRPLEVVLDTGMTFEGLLLYKDLGDELDLANTIDIQVGGAGGGRPSTGVMADSVSFFVGPVECRNQRIVVLRDSPMAAVRGDGVTGYSLFGRYAVEIDYPRKTIRLHRPQGLAPDSSWVSIPLRFKDNTIPWLDATVSITGQETVPLSVYVDLAASETVELLIRDGMKFELPSETRESYLGTGLSGDIHGRVGRIASLAIGPFVLQSIDASFVEAGVRSKQPDADGILGNGAFERFHVIFDYASKHLYMK